MRRVTITVAAAFGLLATHVFGLNYDADGSCYSSSCYGRDLAPQIPRMKEPVLEGFRKTGDVAQYGRADWNNVIGMVQRVSLAQAAEIANSNPEIEFFFYVKGSMVLVREDGDRLVFRGGDAVFFSGKPWWGSAPDLADGYEKVVD